MATLYLELQADAKRMRLPMPGMFAEIEIVGPLRDNVYRLPHAARQDDDTVWIVLDDALRSLAADRSSATRRTVGWWKRSTPARGSWSARRRAPATGLAVTAAVASLMTP